MIPNFSCENSPERLFSGQVFPCHKNILLIKKTQNSFPWNITKHILKVLNLAGIEFSMFFKFDQSLRNFFYPQNNTDFLFFFAKLNTREFFISSVARIIWDALRDFVPFVQFKKREKAPMRSVAQSFTFKYLVDLLTH